MTKAYSLYVDEDYQGLCQSTAAGANSKNKDINRNLIEQAFSNTEVRLHDTKINGEIIDWKIINNSPEYIKDISLFITEILPTDFYDFSYFDISHSESRFSHYINKINSVLVKDKLTFQKQRWLAHTIEVFSWYFYKEIHATHILSVGCGNGYELFFLRHRYPKAKIIAVDWVNKVPKIILEKLDISFHETNIYNFLESHSEEYDLIYSSHVLEHSYKIDALLNLLNTALVQGGTLASSLPLCGFENTLYFNFLERVLEGKSALRQMDCNMLDLGHPWKTNQYDLFSSLQKARFQDIEILGNLESCVRGRSISFERWKKESKFLFNMHLNILNSFKNLIYLFLKDPLPYSVVNLNSNLDWKLEFGGGRIANFVPEVFFTAKKNNVLGAKD
jgi:2-polyprenyl-3-methyl-5-hydroxy-6-metoxy-1,4-benzoquinol methylase